VRSYDQALEELRALTARAASMAGESVDSQGTNDNSPSTVYIAGEDDDAAAGAGRDTAAPMSPALSVTSKPRGFAAAGAGDAAAAQQYDQEVEQQVMQKQQYFPESW
jgi:hypothetical protein